MELDELVDRDEIIGFSNGMSDLKREFKPALVATVIMARVRAAPKLTDSHIYPGHFKKMKVNYASKVFSNTVATDWKRVLRQTACAPKPLKPLPLLTHELTRPARINTTGDPVVESKSESTGDHFAHCLIAFDNVHRTCGRNLRKEFPWTTASKPEKHFYRLAMEYKPLNLGQGFPDYPPPEYITDALMQVASDGNLHQYTRGYMFHSDKIRDMGQAFDKVWDIGLCYKLKKFLPHLFYLLFTADLPTTVLTTVATFADDTAVLASHNCPRKASNNLQLHLNKIQT
ncbi:hypothetical protein HUJ04_011363 [Dendroctonus ponderosae]|nr:hypothetical protein HUJ04_011363 [Dendroctonus ponderosae]